MIILQKTNIATDCRFSVTSNNLISQNQVIQLLLRLSFVT